MSRLSPRVSALHLHRAADGTLSASRRAAPTLSEEPLEIRLIDGPRYHFPRTPGHDVELAHGLLYAEGHLSRAEDLSETRYCAGAEGEDHCNTYNVLDLRVRAQPHPRPTPATGNARLNPAEAQHLLEATPPAQPEGLRRASALWPGASPRPSITREDLTARNSVDKVVGSLLLHNPATALPAEGAFLLLNSRPTPELLRRAHRAGFRGVSSPLRPTERAVGYARAHGLVALYAGRTGVLYSGELDPAGA
ncbi:formate dehydrogenase accessory sulfurtransferase FdhD [Corynebacterium oculi]|uniref:Protein FdhD n=1 Tax=Corynebacterium oculi TaxID=1544416 RepID=A0A0Q0YDC1_9CORY|nr:formate dehydrogenase accessory sulfurtransferase FdhD [Corynebacterium oculi]KQB84304.1 Protein FdhD [Corynebacterium oculi]